MLKNEFNRIKSFSKIQNYVYGGKMEQKDKREIVKILIDELEVRGLIKKDNSSFKNTEKILFNYNKLKESITDRKEQIDDIIAVGVLKKSKSITSISSNNAPNYDDNEILEQSINSLNKHIERTKIIIKHIDRVLDKFKDDPYFDIIKLYYFDGKSYEQIAEFYDNKNKKESTQTASSTISRNKNRLVNAIKVLLLPNDFLSEILGYY